MSIGSDYLADTEFERDVAINRWEKLSIKVQSDIMHGLWRTADGRILSVHEMSSNHIRNCMAMLKRNNNPFEEQYRKMFENELAERKEE